MLIHALIREKTVTRNMDSTPTFYQRDQRPIFAVHATMTVLRILKFFRKFEKKFSTILLNVKNDAYRPIWSEILIRNTLIVAKLAYSMF